MADDDLTAGTVRDYLRRLDGGWVPDDTVDTFKTGGPDDPVAAVGVCWMPYAHTVAAAAERGCDLLVVHEPAFYDHRDDPWSGDAGPLAERAAGKRERVRDLGLTILRCHDLWDQYPGLGVPDEWGRHLGLDDAPAPPVDADCDDGRERTSDRTSEGYYRVYEVESRPARSVVASLASNLAGAGQEAVELVGSGDATVERVAVGTGAITPLSHLVETYDADLYVCTDDGFTYWRDGAFAVDAGVPVAVVNHATAEVRAMERLADRLDATLDVPVHHFEQGCMYDLVGATGDD